MSPARKPRLKDTKPPFRICRRISARSFESPPKSKTRYPALSKSGINAPRKALEAGTPLHPLTQEIKQRQFQRPFSGNCVRGNTQPLAKSAEIGAVIFQLPKVLFARGGR